MEHHPLPRVLSRLGERLSELGQNCAALQEVMGELAEHVTDQNSLSALQSLDRLTQELGCLGRLAETLSDLAHDQETRDASAALAVVQLESLRDALRGAAPQADIGEAELF